MSIKRTNKLLKIALISLVAVVFGFLGVISKKDSTSTYSLKIGSDKVWADVPPPPPPPPPTSSDGSSDKGDGDGDTPTTDGDDNASDG